MDSQLIFVGILLGFVAGCFLQVFLIRAGLWSVLDELKRIRWQLSQMAPPDDTT